MIFCHYPSPVVEFFVDRSGLIGKTFVSYNVYCRLFFFFFSLLRKILLFSRRFWCNPILCVALIVCNLNRDLSRVSWTFKPVYHYFVKYLALEICTHAMINRTRPKKGIFFFFFLHQKDKQGEKKQKKTTRHAIMFDVPYIRALCGFSEEVYLYLAD